MPRVGGDLGTHCAPGRSESPARRPGVDACSAATTGSSCAEYGGPVRVLQVLWDGGGNVTPQLVIARRLIERGHEVRVLGHRSLHSRVTAAGAAFAAYERAPDSDSSRPETDLIRDWEARTSIGAAASVRDRVIYGPALAFARDVAAELDRFRPDVAAVDFMLAGGLVAVEAHGGPAVALIHTVYPLPTPGVPPFGMGLRRASGPLGRTRDALLRRLLLRLYAPGLRPLNAARAAFGLEPLESSMDQLERIPLALVLTAPELDFAGGGPLPPNVRYAGPVVERPSRAGWSSPWPEDPPDPLVVASFSTTYQDQRALAARVLEALGQLPVRGLLTVGPAIDVSGLSVPGNVEVRDFVPHAAVLPDASLVATHAGLGTVHAALAAGVPLVCLPHGRDQADNAARVVEAGAGIRLSRRASPARLRRAIAAALADHRLREGAARMAAAFATQDGATRVAEEFEALARR
jgi:UDP:flavonoid glycosyltransferase YjiC (YdhE family)